MISAPLAKDYVPLDRLFIFWLADPATPQLVGFVDLNPRLKSADFEYIQEWIDTGFALSPDLPLRTGTFNPVAEHLPGSIDDARPDRWGERVIRLVDAPKRLSILEYLLFAGDDRFGALGVSISRDAYVPCARGSLPNISDIGEIHEAILAIELGRPLDERLARVVRPGATLGGAKPKALVVFNGKSHVLKFPERDEIYDMGLVEHATMRLASKAGIRVSMTEPVALGGNRGHAIAVQRFDRVFSDSGGPASRIHAMSCRTALMSVGDDLSYPNLALFLRRFGDGSDLKNQVHELFRRMVFNILMDNTDDHERNHALLSLGGGRFQLSAAFDVLPTCQNLGYQQIGVGDLGSESTMENALSQAKSFLLSEADARKEVFRVIQVVSGWQAHFHDHGVSSKDIDVLRTSIDRQFLLDQRAPA